MQYMGGKYRQAKKIVSHIQPYVDKYGKYLEPFAGVASVGSRINADVRIISDVNPEIIALLNAVTYNGYVPPEFVTEEEYDHVRDNLEKYPDYARALFSYGLSVNGSYWAGYAKNRRGDNFARNARNSLMKKGMDLRSSIFCVADYESYQPKNFVIYCDPPYITTGGVYCDVNHYNLWDILKEWAIHNIVFITEFQAPRKGAKLIDTFQRQHITNIGNRSYKKVTGENLYMVVPT